MMSNNMSSPPSNSKQQSPPNSDLESLSSNSDNDKAHSFRERRLTYTRHHVLSDNAAAAVAELLADGTNDFSSDDDVANEDAKQPVQLKDVEEEESGAAAPSNEKRKLSNTDNLDVDDQPKKKKPRISIKLSANSATATTTSNNKKQLNHLPSRILHAGEIVCRLSEEEDSLNGEGRHGARTGLYSHRSHPNHHHTSNGLQKNKWRRRFSFTKSTPDSQLPFPRYQVGTFSCAGLEPLYDSDYGSSSSSSDDESWDGKKEREENGGWDKEKESDKESEDEDCGSSGDGGIYANNSSPSNNNNAGRGKVLPTSNPNNKSPISPIKKQKHTTSKINQDRGGITYPYANSTNMALFSVYDGHGERGELVSQFALGEVGRLLEERLVSLDSKGKGRLEGIAEDEEEESDQDNNNNEQDNTINQQQQNQQEEEYITTSIKQVFNQIDNDLLNEEDIEPMYSGTTACIVLLKESKLYIGNCGDSRAILAKKKKKKRCHTKEEGKDVGEEETELITIDLSTDQNPDSPGEKERIESLGGFVSPPPEPGLSSRVWLDSAHTQIGLAMARSIGDHAVKGVGVISEPEVTTHTIDEDVDEFVIIATDGVWEFLSSEDAVDIVQKHLYSADYDEEKKKGGGYGASVACEALIKAASDKWHEHEGNYRDDITAIVVRLKDLLR